MAEINQNNLSVDGRRCSCGRGPYEKHKDNCDARKQCRGCDRNIYEPHREGCSYVNDVRAPGFDWDDGFKRNS